MSRALSEMLDEVLLLSGMDTETSYVGQGTAAVERIVSIANQAAAIIAQWPWQALRSRYSFTLSTATEYELPADYRAFIPDTMYTADHLWPADFPASTSFWSYLQTSAGGSGARYHVRLLGNRMHVYAPDDGQEVTFEYLSKYPVLDSGGTAKERFTADTDTFRLDEELLIKEIGWRYKKLLGLDDWQVDLAECKAYEIVKKGQDKAAKTLTPHPEEITGPYYNLWRPVPNE